LLVGLIVTPLIRRRQLLVDEREAAEFRDRIGEYWWLSAR
jgi:hypothetical protein